MPRPQIDRDKLRAAIRTLGDEYIFYILDEAIDLLPDAKLAKLARRYIDPARVRPDSNAEGGGLLADVKQFEQASLRGEYYEGFNVNSKNFMDKSKSTRAWISECHRLLDRCVTRAKTDDQAEVRAAFDIIFGLLYRIDECPDDVIFFADEAGSWQVGVDWCKVLPPWFACLSATAGPDEFARRVTAVVGDLADSFDRMKHLSAASRVASPEQRKALRASPIAPTPA